MDTVTATITNARFAYSTQNGFYLQIECDWDGCKKGEGSVHCIYGKDQVDSIMLKGGYDDATGKLGISESELNNLEGIKIKVAKDTNPKFMGVI